MATFRVQKKETFVVLDKGFLNNPDISWQAKGLLAYMLSLPNDWEFNIKDLSTRSKNGRDATKNIINELTIAGYIRKQQQRNGKGTFGNLEWIVHEIPHPLTENPSTDNPLTEEPLPENPSQLNNKELNNKELNKDKDDKGQAPVKETAFQFYEQNGFGTISGYIGEKIGAWIDDLSEEIVIEAMKIATEINARNWKYVETVLRDWSNKKFKSITDVEADRLRYEVMKKQRQSSSSKKTGKTEVIPDWFDKRNENSNNNDLLNQQTELEQSESTSSPYNEIDFEEERRKILSKLNQP